MKTLVCSTFAALVLALTLGTAHADKAAPAAKDDGETMMQLMEKIADIIDKDKADCDKMAGDLGKFFDANGAEIKRLKEASKTKTDAEKKALREKYAERFKAVMAKMADGGKKCEGNEKVRAVMDRMK